MRQTNLILIACAGLAIGAIFGIFGSLVADPIMQILLYEISSVGLTSGCALLTIKYIQEKEELMAAGFLLFAIAEAVMSGGSAVGQIGGQAAFGAGLALYLPALWLISSTKKFSILFRFTGIAATIPFGIAAAKIFMGTEVLSTSALPGAGYGLLSLTIFGWIWSLLKKY
ncbi:MAG: hypothetical protein IPL46_24405 [Saprospiraceae bacterium]|nr:hypothetical protein [Saprospiraceae bacterium]